MKNSFYAWREALVAMALVLAAAGSVAAQQPPLSAVEQARLADRAARQAAAERVVSEDEAAFGRGRYDPAQRNQIIKALASKPVSEIQATPVGTTSLMLGPQASGIGDTVDNLVYFPVANCRVIDTRLIGGGGGSPIIPGTNRNFIVVTSAAGANSFAAQGGAPNDCGTTWPGPAAAMLNVVAVGPASPGDLRIFPFGSGVPNASAINYIPGQNVANGIIQPICQGCGFDITVQADAAQTHLVVDILGYFMFPTTPVTQNLFAVVNSNGTVASAQSFRATGSSKLGTGIYEVDFDRNVTNCVYQATIGDAGAFGVAAGEIGATGRAGNANGVFVVTRNSSGTLADQSFHFIVMCPPAPASP